jgi:hypothetical protein
LTLHPTRKKERKKDDDDVDDDDDDVDSTTFTQLQQVVHHDVDNDNASDSEPWVDWIRRCTHEVEERMWKLKLDDWITIQRRRKWRWAGNVAQTSREDWTAMAIRWDPTIDPKLKARRQPGRPKTRWTNDICSHIT